MVARQFSVGSLLVLFSLLLGGGVLNGPLIAFADPSGHAPHGTVTVDGITVPDIGPMPTQVPTPATT